MRAFVAYRHTGEDARQIDGLLAPVKSVLAAREINAYSTYFDVHGGNVAVAGPVAQSSAFMQEAFRMMAKSDLLLVLQASELRSEGMLMEVGYALAKGLPVVVATQQEVADTYLPDMAHAALRWTDVADLVAQLAEFDFEGLRAGEEAT